MPSVDTPDVTNPVIVVSSEDPRRIDVGAKMGVLVDAANAITIDRVVSEGHAWQVINRRSANFGFTDAAHWFRFIIDNQSGRTLDKYFELGVPFINDVRFYQFSDGKKITEYELGSLKPFSQRLVRHQNLVMPVALAPGKNMLIFRLASTGTIEAPIRVWDRLRFTEFNHDEKIAHGALAGIMLVMVLYNLFIYFSVRDVSYLYYIGFVSSYMLMHFTLTGYSYLYLWPEASYWNSIAISTFLSSSGLFANLFALSFLKLKETSPMAYSISRGLAVLSGLIVLLTFVVPYHLTVRVGTALSVLSTSSALLFGYWLWYKGKRYARFFCLAWSAFLLGAIALLAQKYGMVPTNFWTLNAAQIGIVLLVLLLSVTLADQINMDRKLRIDAQSEALEHETQARYAQQELLDSQERANRVLEQKVEERTKDLNETLEQLTIANDQLQLLSTTDGLTQVNNRAFFDKALETEHRRALRVNCGISIIIFDIDHFKRINDTYGHIGGDECLRALAKLMKLLVNRTGDVLARYGGEEFVVMLIDPDLESSVAMAEQFRSEIERIEVPFNEKTIRFTASFGVACVVPNENISANDVLACADKALYEAKLAGRNCVRAGSFLALS